MSLSVILPDPVSSPNQWPSNEPKLPDTHSSLVSKEDSILEKQRLFIFTPLSLFEKAQAMLLGGLISNAFARDACTQLKRWYPSEIAIPSETRASSAIFETKVWYPLVEDSLPAVAKDGVLSQLSIPSVATTIADSSKSPTSPALPWRSFSRASPPAYATNEVTRISDPPRSEAPFSSLRPRTADTYVAPPLRIKAGRPKTSDAILQSADSDQITQRAANFKEATSARQNDNWAAKLIRQMENGINGDYSLGLEY